METTVDNYLKKIEEYLKSELQIFSDDDSLTYTEIRGGNINHTYRVTNNLLSKTVILKHAESEANISKKIVVDVLRGKKEAELLLLYNRLMPGYAPDVLGYNENLHTLVLSDLCEYGVLQDRTTEIERYTFIPEQLSEFLSRLLISTSDFCQDSKAKKNSQKHFINPDLCEITEKLVFRDPYVDGYNYVTAENKEFVVNNIIKNNSLKNSVAELKYKFMTEGQALIHGDLHFGSVFVNDSQIAVFDPEFSFYGPMGYDIGNIIAHFIIEYLVSDDDSIKQILKRYLLMTVELILKKMLLKINNESAGFDFCASVFIKNMFCQIFQDSLGYAGTECIRRIAGIAKIKKIEELDGVSKSATEKKILEAGIFLIKNRETVTDYSCFEDFISKIL